MFSFTKQYYISANKIVWPTNKRFNRHKGALLFYIVHNINLMSKAIIKRQTWAQIHNKNNNYNT